MTQIIKKKWEETDQIKYSHSISCATEEECCLVPSDIALINPLAALIASGTTTSCASDTMLGCICPLQIDPLRSLGESLESCRGDDLAVFVVVLGSLGVADMPDVV
jgi:hypothetical protein